MHIRV